MWQSSSVLYTVSEYMATRREIIGIDIDDVLSQSALGFVAYSNTHWGAHHSVDDYSEDWAAFWGIPRAEAMQRAHEYHLTGDHTSYEPFQQALPVLNKLASTYDLIVITSRRTMLRPQSDKWLAEHFPGIFQAIHFVGIWDTEHAAEHKLTLTKAELCRQLGVQYLIDDQTKHCIAAADAGITALLFGEYSWNKTPGAHVGIVRVADWPAVERYFDAAKAQA